MLGFEPGSVGARSVHSALPEASSGAVQWRWAGLEGAQGWAPQGSEGRAPGLARERGLETRLGRGEALGLPPGQATKGPGQAGEMRRPAC